MFLTSTRVPNASVPARPQRDVRLHAHLAVLHRRIRRADGHQQQPQLLRVAARGLGRTDDGSVTISMSGMPRAVEVDEAARGRPPGVASRCSSRAVSSSRWARVIADGHRIPREVSNASDPPAASGRSYWLIW